MYSPSSMIFMWRRKLIWYAVAPVPIVFLSSPVGKFVTIIQLKSKLKIKPYNLHANSNLTQHSLRQLLCCLQIRFPAKILSSVNYFLWKKFIKLANSYQRDKMFSQNIEHNLLRLQSWKFQVIHTFLRLSNSKNK